MAASRSETAPGPDKPGGMGVEACVLALAGAYSLAFWAAQSWQIWQAVQRLL